MKIDEAISLLKQYIDYDNPDVPDFYTMEEAIKVIIEALEQEPCADMVSRDAMWDVLQRLYGTEGELVEELMSLPPVLPMPKMGKWIPCIDDDGDDFFLCSECRNGEYYRSDYCPHCGSKLDSTECF